MPKTIDMDVIKTHMSCLLNNRDRFVFSYGGAGSGKSHTVGQRQLLRSMLEPNRRILLVRKYMTHIRQSQFQLIKSLIYEHSLERIFKINESEMRILCKPTGNEILSFGVDNPERLKSIFGITDVWIEEMTELEENDFDQINLRVRNSKAEYNQIIGTFNPINKRHWINKRFFNGRIFPFNKPERLEETISFGSESVTNHITVLRTNYECNRFLPLEYKATLEAMRLKNPMFYQIYVNAEWGDSAEGLIFKRDFYQEYDSIPPDARGVIYCDPNLAKKAKGDTTAIFKLLYAPSTGRYYVANCICRSYSDAQELVRDVLSLRSDNARIIGFDGNYGQESHWGDHIQQYRKQHNIPPFRVDFKRYNVDTLAKSAQWMWGDGLILFPRGFEKTEMGQEALSQIYTFCGKKNTKTGMKDDAPDALICAIELLIDYGMAAIGSAGMEIMKTFINKGA